MENHPNGVTAHPLQGAEVGNRLHLCGEASSLTTGSQQRSSCERPPCFLR